MAVLLRGLKLSADVAAQRMSAKKVNDRTVERQDKECEGDEPEERDRPRATSGNRGPGTDGPGDREGRGPGDVDPADRRGETLVIVAGGLELGK